MSGVDPRLSVFAAAKECPRAAGLVCQGRVWSWGELAELAAAECARVETPPAGRPVPVVAAATVETAALYLGLLARGVAALMLHPKLTAPELARQRAQADTIAAALPAGTAAVLFTSGTTGKPKAAMLPARALLASAAASAANMGWEPADRWQLCMSLARVGGLSILTRCLAVRKPVVLTPKFRAETFPEEIARDGVTITSVVPTMLSKVLDAHPGWVAPGALRAVLLGGAPASEKLLARARAARVPVLQTYGMTEACSHVAMTPYAERFSGGAPRILPGARARVAAGELQVAGPMLMSGYWGGAALPEGGWFATGDMGEVDGGAVRVFARRTDLILSGGDNVYPAEVEAELERCPGVARAIVLGVPDETWGAVVCALLVAEGRPLSDAAVREWCRAHLASFKRPRLVGWVGAIPETAAGKPDHRADARRLAALRVLHYTA